MLSLKKCKTSAMILSAALLVSALPGCGDNSQSNIISSELVSEEGGFGQDTAQTGDFVDTKTYDAKRIYPISNVITSSYDGVILKKINVKAQQEVKKGDLLVTIEQVTEDMLAEKEAALAKSQEDTQAVLDSYKISMSNLEHNISVSSGTQKKSYETELAKIKVQYEWYQQTAIRDQESVKSELEYLRSLQGDLNIYAPYDGIIDTISNVPEGTELDTTRELLTMHSEEQIMLQVSNGADMRYMQSVTVETGSGEKIKSYKGTVISCNDVRSDAFKNGSATIRLDEQIPPDELSNVRVKATTKELYNVLVVRNYAVSTEKDKNYVSILEDDKIMKRRVITGGSCGDYTWILQGLEDGQTVTIQ